MNKIIFFICIFYSLSLLASEETAWRLSTYTEYGTSHRIIIMRGEDCEIINQTVYGYVTQQRDCKFDGTELYLGESLSETWCGYENRQPTLETREEKYKVKSTIMNTPRRALFDVMDLIDETTKDQEHKRLNFKFSPVSTRDASGHKNRGKCVK